MCFMALRCEAPRMSDTNADTICSNLRWVSGPHCPVSIWRARREHWDVNRHMPSDDAACCRVRVAEAACCAAEMAS